jgi:predicted AAA+ superfamily ATPase
MAHYRGRVLEKLIAKSIGWAPIVGVTGARQSGKTTLLKRFCESQLSFDDPALEARFRSSGLLALEGLKRPILLDEVQKFEPAFDLLKLAVEENRRPGQFLITGSVRFSSKKGIRESLTGRGQFWEILPLTVQECHQKEFEDLPALLLHPRKTLGQKLASLERRAWLSDSQAADYLEKGGLPGICFLRDASQRVQALDSYLETSLTRDLTMLYSTRLRFAQVMDLFREVVAHPGEPINMSLLARRLGTSVPTIKGLLAAIEGIYLIRRQGRSYFGEDPSFSPRGRQEVRRFAFTVVRAWSTYLKDHQLTLGEHVTRGGSHVPFVLRSRTGAAMGITTDEDVMPSEKSMKSLQSFARLEKGAVLVSVHRGQRAFVHRERILAVPWTWLV